jgi:hypothetical protein
LEHVPLLALKEPNAVDACPMEDVDGVHLEPMLVNATNLQMPLKKLATPILTNAQETLLVKFNF